MKQSHALRAGFRAVHAHEITWAQLYRQTSREWEKLAKHLFRKWKLPAGVEPVDIEQQLLLEAYIAIGKFKAGGMPLDEYVVWCACAMTKRWMHKQRQALRRDGSAPSRHEVSFTELGTEPDIETEGRQDIAVEALELLAQALWKLNVLSRQLLFAVVSYDGSVDSAAEEVYEHADLRRVYRWESVADARHEVRQVMQTVAAAA